MSQPAIRTPDVPAAPSGYAVGINLQQVTKRFEVRGTSTLALDTVNLTIGDGEFLAVVGPSGCGKSTMMRIVAGLTPCSDGKAIVFGRQVDGPVPQTGIVFQSPVLLEWRKILENVLFQAEIRGLDPKQHLAAAQALLRKTGLKDFADRYPHELSGGMRQRASICRALLLQPKLLLMDEPFGALDALTREQMRIDLENLWLSNKMTVIFITHSIDEAVLLADRVIVMSPRPGRIERILEIDMPRPRGLEARKHPVFLEVSETITSIFLERGVLHGQH